MYPAGRETRRIVFCALFCFMFEFYIGKADLQNGETYKNMARKSTGYVQPHMVALLITAWETEAY